jgi:hypothetical protein
MCFVAIEAELKTRKCQGNGGVYINSGCWPRLLGKKSFVVVSIEL